MATAAVVFGLAVMAGGGWVIRGAASETDPDAELPLIAGLLVVLAGAVVLGVGVGLAVTAG